MLDEYTTHRALALALLEAEESTYEDIEGLWRSVISKLEDLERDCLMEFITVLVGAVSMRCDESPRRISELLFQQAPSDEEWGSTIRPRLQALIDSA